MKYEALEARISLPERRGWNEKCLASLDQETPALTKGEVYHYYTGVGGLHGLEYKDFSSYRDFSEAKKEIEQGQFFTSDILAVWAVDCLRPGELDKIADLTFGKGSFFNHMPVEENLYGCEIDNKSFSIARHLFDKAHLHLGDIRTYEPGVLFDLVVGNPPYNITWEYRQRRCTSQTAYLLKAADLLYPAGICAVIVPETFLGDGTLKIEKKMIFQRFNHVVQVSLDPNAFSYLGVRNFPTKLLVLQKKAKAMPDIPYSPELVRTDSSEEIYLVYIRPAKEARKAAMPQIQLELSRSRADKAELLRTFQLYLYQIKAHPRTVQHHSRMEQWVNQYLTQRCPPGMRYSEWRKTRIHSREILTEMKRILAGQNRMEADKVALVKGETRIYYKAYSEKVKPMADARNREMEMQEINRLVPFGSADDLRLCGQYMKLLQKKQRLHRIQTMPFSQMEEEPSIREWLLNWKLTGLTEDFQTTEIRLNEMQLHDVNLALQKPFAYLHWSQGAGKTVAGTAMGMYRLARDQTQYVFVVSSAISIETTWAPFLKLYGIRHKVIQHPNDFRRVYPGDFILITLGRVNNYQKKMREIVKIGCQKQMLIYDEAHNSSNLESSDEEGRITKAVLSCFTRLKYKVLMSGTAISNNVVEAYPQLYLLYNASYNMLSMCETLYSYDEGSDTYDEYDNLQYGKPYPPYMEGKNLFRASHLPEKLTVFGVVKTTPDIFNAYALRDIISYTMLTRTFPEVTGKNLERCEELPAEMLPEEAAFYQIALKEFYRLEHLYFKSQDIDARKKAQARIIAQIKIMLQICVCASVYPDYTGPAWNGKLEAIAEKIDGLPGQRVAIGLRTNEAVRIYSEELQKRYPDRPVFTITGSQYTPKARRKLVYGSFSDYPDSILVCTQQSLSESMSIDFVDHCFIPEMHWNNSRMSQFYYRFIRYTSTREKYIYYVTYPESIETNLMYLLVSKERMLRFLKGEDISFHDLFADMGFDFSIHQGVVVKMKDKEGRTEFAWGQQKIAA